MKNAFIAAGLVVLFGLLIGAYFYLPPAEEKGAGNGTKSFVAASQRSDTAVEKPPEGWSEYQSERYGFSLFYPAEMAVSEFDEGKGASTLTFEDKQGGRGFQIFAVPYSGTQVSEERFLRDIPSGVRENPVDFYVAGVLATVFYSRHPLLGDTIEVWFIRGGYLFELTTLKPLEDLLAEIIQTWRFL